jgi:hypothetical protein
MTFDYEYSVRYRKNVHGKRPSGQRHERRVRALSYYGTLAFFAPSYGDAPPPHPCQFPFRPSFPRHGYGGGASHPGARGSLSP